MGAVEQILIIGSVITAISAIIAFCVKIYKFIRKWDKWVDAKDKHDRENYLAILRLNIISEEMPLSERVTAGDKYIKLNGNGEVKLKYEKLLKILEGSE